MPENFSDLMIKSAQIAQKNCKLSARDFFCFKKELLDISKKNRIKNALIVQKKNNLQARNNFKD